LSRMAKHRKEQAKNAKARDSSRLYIALAVLAAMLAVGFGAAGGMIDLSAAQPQKAPAAVVERPPPVERTPAKAKAASKPIADVRGVDERRPPAEKPPVEQPPVEQAASGPVAPTPDPNCADKASVAECSGWARIGECDANPGFMLVQCASSCNKCEMMDYRKRCAVDETVPLSVPPGEMDETFRHASSARFASLEPVVLSSDPWVLQFDTFLSDEEADAFIRGGATKGWALSEDAGAMRSDGSFEAIRSSHRTSMTAWCDTAACQADAHIQHVMQRAENVTRLPQANSEFVQVLQYEVGQYYGGHHDFIPAHSRLPCGPRVYTLFMYLSDVEEGGETEFNSLKIHAKPKKGRALLWPSTFDARPLEQDHRTFHEAKPVIRGTKHAANMWLHQFDFKKAHRLGCTG